MWPQRPRLAANSLSRTSIRADSPFRQAISVQSSVSSSQVSFPPTAFRARPRHLLGAWPDASLLTGSCGANAALSRRECGTPPEVRSLARCSPLRGRRVGRPTGSRDLNGIRGAQFARVLTDWRREASPSPPCPPVPDLDRRWRRTCRRRMPVTIDGIALNANAENALDS